MSARRPRRSLAADLLALALFVSLCLGVGALAASVTATSVATWYVTLDKPSFTPPGAVFGPVWTILYVLMGVAAWRVWRAADRDAARGPLAIFALQLALNLGWSVAFFGLRAIAPAFVVILALDLAVVSTMLSFRRLDRPASLLLLPYLAWILFATLLNAAIWRLN